MKRYFLILPVCLMFIGCSRSQTKNVDRNGAYSGPFTHGNFSDSISFEIQKDSTEWKVFFTSLQQNAVGIPSRNVSVEGDSIRFVLQSDRYTYNFANRWNDTNSLLSGTLEVDTLIVPYVLHREMPREEEAIINREIVFESNGIRMGGTIWQPSTSGNKALVFLSSSGAGDRSASRAEAIYFAKKGYITFHYDKRGTGVSEGNWEVATMEELMSDDGKAIAHFAKRTGVPLSNIGIKGSSQGGAKVPFVLNKLPALKFGISVSCPASTLLESDLNYWKNRNREVLGDDLEAAAELQGKVFGHIAGKLTRTELEKEIKNKKTKSWFPKVWVPNLDEVQVDEKLLFSPMPYFKKTKHPMLIIQGKADEIIPRNSHQLISQALEEAENDSYDIVLLEAANHSMQDIGHTDFPFWSKLHENYLKTIEEWIAARY